MVKFNIFFQKKNLEEIQKKRLSKSGHPTKNKRRTHQAKHGAVEVTKSDFIKFKFDNNKKKVKLNPATTTTTK